jgi:aspartate aminotransferase-like enzyme
MAEYVRGWVIEHGYELFPERRYCSQTLTCASNSADTDLAALKKMLGERGYAFDDGYGKIKSKTFRIAHMGDMQLADLVEFTNVIEDCLKRI